MAPGEGWLRSSRQLHSAGMDPGANVTLKQIFGIPSTGQDQSHLAGQLPAYADPAPRIM